MVDRNKAIDALLIAGEVEHKIERLIAEMLLDDTNPSIIAQVADEIRLRADSMVPSIIEELLGHKSAA